MRYLIKNLYTLDKKNLITTILVFLGLWFCVGILFSLIYTVLYISRLVFKKRIARARFNSTA